MSISQNFPNTRPSLNLNFARSKTLYPRITFSRTTTGTYVDESGVIRTADADEPRFDHDPVTGECLGLLVEESRTNLCFYGTTIQNFTTRGSGTPIKTANATTAPDGTVTATRLQGGGEMTNWFDDNSNKQYIAGITYTFSCFFKANGTDKAVILLYGQNWTGADGVSDVVGKFDLTNGTTIDQDTDPTISTRNPSGGAKIESYPNDWYRCSITETCAITHNNIHQLIRSVVNNADFYAWGYQIEQYSTFPSSLIPTTTNQTASRGKEYPTIAGTDFTNFHNSSEGTFYVRYSMKGFGTNSSGFNRIFEVSDGGSGGSANRYTALLRGTNQDIYDSGWNGALNFNTSLITFGDFYTYIMGYKENDFQRYAIDSNGNIDSNTDTSVDVSSFTPTELNIGHQADGDTRILNGHISQLIYYPTRLSNSQLQTLLLQ
jgi:hypothetical protein